MIQLSIIIPAYNEEHRLPMFLARLLVHLDEKIAGQYEVIVVDDGSNDNTESIAKKILANKGTVIRTIQNRGKGAAIKQGIIGARGLYTCISDADGSVEIQAFSDALGMLKISENLGLVGTRYLIDQKDAIEISKIRHVAGLVFAGLTRVILGLRYSDTQCGFKMFRTDLVKNLLAICVNEHFGLDFELLYIAKKNKIAFIELPVGWIEKKGSKVAVFRDGLRMIVDMIRLKFRSPKSLLLSGDIITRISTQTFKIAELDSNDVDLNQDQEKARDYAKTP